MGQPQGITVGAALLWVGAYFCIMLLYTAMDMAVWRKLDRPAGPWLNLAAIAALSAGFLWLLIGKHPFLLPPLTRFSLPGLLAAAGCAVLFFLLLDKGLDPLLEAAFPRSEEAYQQSVMTLLNAPLPAFLRTCLLAPVTEELLMRGFVLAGLRPSLGVPLALALSAALFALLHFNMVQTLSAFVCGLVLGLLYLWTGSLPCCILAHCGYNAISCFIELASHRK